MSILWETTELQQNDFSEVTQEVYIRMKELVYIPINSVVGSQHVMHMLMVQIVDNLSFGCCLK